MFPTLFSLNGRHFISDVKSRGTVIIGNQLCWWIMISPTIALTILGIYFIRGLKVDVIKTNFRWGIFKCSNTSRSLFSLREDYT